jgi:hypothetical protein
MKSTFTGKRRPAVRSNGFPGRQRTGAERKKSSIWISITRESMVPAQSLTYDTIAALLASDPAGRENQTRFAASPPFLPELGDDFTRFNLLRESHWK